MTSAPPFGLGVAGREPVLSRSMSYFQQKESALKQLVSFDLSIGFSFLITDLCEPDRKWQPPLCAAAPLHLPPLAAHYHLLTPLAAM